MPKFENCYFCKTSYYRSSSQDGGVGRNPSLPHTTGRRITTNLKSINNQKCQKIQTAWNSDNQGIKEKINQNNQTGKVADWADLVGGSAQKNRGKAGCGEGRGWLKVKLNLRADYGLWQGLLH